MMVWKNVYVMLYVVFKQWLIDVLLGIQSMIKFLDLSGIVPLDIQSKKGEFRLLTCFKTKHEWGYTMGRHFLTIEPR